jgi:MATE family multidrug resistance protein
LKIACGCLLNPDKAHSRGYTVFVPPVTRRELVVLAIPAAGSALLNNSFRLIDQYAAGGIGTEAQAAIGSCTFVLIACFGVQELVAGGVGALVGRATGARDLEERSRVLGAALLSSVLVGGALSLVLVPGAGLVAHALGLQAQSAQDATIFLQVIACGAPLLSIFPTLDAAFVGMGKTKTMMALQGLAALLNFGLNPLLIHQAGLGVLGAGLATVLARGLCVSVGVAVLVRETSVSWQHIRVCRIFRVSVLPDPGATWVRRAIYTKILTDLDIRLGEETRRLLRLGAPVCINILAYAFVYWAILYWAVSPLGPEVNAALGIGFSALEGVSYPIFLGISLAVSSLVARRLGAGEPEEARQVGILAFPLVAGLGLGVGVIFFVGAEALSRPFTDDPKVLAAAVLYAKTLAFSQVFVALEALAEGILAGAGATRTIFRWSAPVNLLRVPLSYLLSLSFGALGIWWAINLTSFLKASGKGYHAARGEWVRLKI